MKIINKGKLPVVQLRIFQGTCSNCGCQVECNENEANYYGERHLGGKRDWHILCPTDDCLATIILEEVIICGEPLKTTTNDINKTLATTPDLKDVHTEHCCILHGCKYGKDDECTVMTQKASQSFICERCENKNILDVDHLKRLIIRYGYSY